MLDSVLQVRQNIISVTTGNQIMGINTVLASSTGAEISLKKFAEVGSDYIMPNTIADTEDLLDEIGTALFWIHSTANHSNRDTESTFLRSKNLERSLRDIGEIVIRSVIANGGQLLLNGEVVS